MLSASRYVRARPRPESHDLRGVSEDLMFSQPPQVGVHEQLAGEDLSVRHDLRKGLHPRPREVFLTEDRGPLLERPSPDRIPEGGDHTTASGLVRELIALELRESEDTDEAGPQPPRHRPHGKPPPPLPLGHAG